MNVNKEGILITSLWGSYLNIYEIKGKEYKKIQKIKPYNSANFIIGIIKISFSIPKFIELKNGNLAVLVHGYTICFYTYNKISKKYSYLNKYDEIPYENITDLVELDNNQYIISMKYNNMIQFLDMNSQKIIDIIKCDNNFTDAKNELILMNNNDLLVSENQSIIIIDINKKKIIKNIKLNINNYGYLSSIYKISHNILLVGYWNNYIEQIEYDEIKKDLKLISCNEKKSNISNIFTKKMKYLQYLYLKII